MIMFWHRRKLLEIEEQIKSISIQLNETLSSSLSKLDKENAGVQKSLGKIADGLLQLQEGQGKILEQITALADSQHLAQEKTVGLAEMQGAHILKMLELTGSQGNALKALTETVFDVRASLNRAQQEYVLHHQETLSALLGTEHTISEKVTDSGHSIIEAQSGFAKGVSDAIAEIGAALEHGLQDGSLTGEQIMNVLRETKQIISAKVDGQATVVKGDMERLEGELSYQSEAVRGIETTTKQIASDMDVLDESMRLLLVNTLLNNFPEK